MVWDQVIESLNVRLGHLHLMKVLTYHPVVFLRLLQHVQKVSGDISIALTTLERQTSTQGKERAPSHSYPASNSKPLFLPSLMHHFVGQLGWAKVP